MAELTSDVLKLEQAKLPYRIKVAMWRNRLIISVNEAIDKNDTKLDETYEAIAELGILNYWFKGFGEPRDFEKNVIGIDKPYLEFDRDRVNQNGN